MNRAGVHGRKAGGEQEKELLKPFPPQARLLLGHTLGGAQSSVLERVLTQDAEKQVLTPPENRTCRKHVPFWGSLRDQGLICSDFTCSRGWSPPWTPALWTRWGRGALEQGSDQIQLAACLCRESVTEHSHTVLLSTPPGCFRQQPSVL